MNLINRIVDLFRKKKILKATITCGCDLDGDLLVYKGTTYWVNWLNGIVMRTQIREEKNHGEERKDCGLS